MAELLSEEKKEFVEEVSLYWSDSFGNLQRIDYGTGEDRTMRKRRRKRGW